MAKAGAFDDDKGSGFISGSHQKVIAKRRLPRGRALCKKPQRQILELAMSRYEHDDGDWFTVPKELKQQCCSCGLVHVIEFRRNKAKIMEMRFTRDERATAAARRPRKKAVVIVDE